MDEPFATPPPLGSDAAADTVSSMPDRALHHPGWYPDPAGSGLLRFHDGRSFTHTTMKPERGSDLTDAEAARSVPAFSTPAFASDTLDATAAFLSPPTGTPELRVPLRTTILRLLRPRQSGTKALLRVAGTMCLLVSVTTLGYALWENRLSAWTAARAQSALRSEFEAAMAVSSKTTTPPVLAVPEKGKKAATTTTTTQPLQPPPMLATGAMAGRLTIPSIGLDKMVLIGTNQDILAKGPGVWESGVFPGAPGNATISAHRTTHGGPFRHIDQLKNGDRIIFETPGQPRAVFEVRGTGQVSPRAIEVTGQGPGVRLTLTTCDPPGSAARRLVIQAELVEGDFVKQALSPGEWDFRGEGD